MSKTHIALRRLTFSICMLSLLFLQAGARSTAARPVPTETQASLPGPYPVKQISQIGQGSSPTNFVNFRGQMYFSATNTNGTEGLFRYSSITGIQLVKDGFHSIRWLGAAGDSLFIGNQLYDRFGSPESSVVELWKSDGSAAGTMLFTSLPGFSGYSSAALGSKILFNLTEQLWVSDGTVAGTFQLNTQLKLDPVMAVMNGRLYFLTNERTNGNDNIDLWSTDGTQGGTALVKNLFPSSIIQDVWGLNTLGSKLIFLSHSDQSPKLWTSDGTPQGTQPLIEILGASESPLPTVIDGVYYFTSFYPTYQLYRSDGTLPGTFVLLERNCLAPVQLNGGNLLIAVLNGKYELWKSDGTPDGTVPFLTNMHFKNIRMMTSVLGLAYLQVDVQTWPELWRSDGTQTGTFALSDAYTYDPLAWIYGSWLTIHQGPDGKAYFGKWDAQVGSEIWQSDGTKAGTRLLKDINTALSDAAIGSLTPFGDKLVFLANDGQHGSQVWMSDGTGPGTTMISQVQCETDPGVQGPPRIQGVMDDAFYFYCNGVWRSDGTAAGTYKITSDPITDIAIKGHRFFGNSQDTLYLSDGTPGGTIVVRSGFRKDCAYGYCRAEMGDLAWLGQKVYFYASVGDQPYRLWTSDGTDAGTLPWDLLNYQAIYKQGSIRAAGERLYFYADDGVHGVEPWTSDGTPAGTYMLRDIAPGTASSCFDYSIFEPCQYTVLGNNVFFINQINSVNQLWKTEGTQAGTVLVKNLIDDQGYSGEILDLMAMGGLVYFTLQKPQWPNSTVQLWKSDGSPDGTQIVKEYNSFNSNGVSDLQVMQDRLYFSVDGQVWSSDGMATGTQPFFSTSGYVSSFLALPLGGQPRLFYADSVYPGLLWGYPQTVTPRLFLSNVDKP